MTDRGRLLSKEETTRQPRARWEDDPIVSAPATFTVDHEHKPLLYLPNGKVLVKRAGF